MLNAQINKKR